MPKRSDIIVPPIFDPFFTWDDEEPPRLEDATIPVGADRDVTEDEIIDEYNRLRKENQ